MAANGTIHADGERRPVESVLFFAAPDVAACMNGLMDSSSLFHPVSKYASGCSLNVGEMG